MNIKRQDGISLIEVAIFFTVIGILSMSVLARLSWVVKERKIATTQQNLDTIEDALGYFAKNNSRLPCPADPSVSYDNFGKENCSVSGGIMLVSGNTVYIGAVPVRELGLPRSFAMDGWGRHLLYAVTKSITPDDSLDNSSIKSIRIIDKKGDFISNYYYALLSQGSNGNGMYLNNGEKFNGGCNTSEWNAENCAEDNIFQDFWSHRNKAEFFLRYYLDTSSDAAQIKNYERETMELKLNTTAEFNALKGDCDSNISYGNNAWGEAGATAFFVKDGIMVGSGTNAPCTSSKAAVLWQKNIEAKSTGEMILRATIPIRYYGSENPVLVAVCNGNRVVGKGNIFDPRNLVPSSHGGTGVVSSSFAIAKGTTYNLSVRAYTIKSNVSPVTLNSCCVMKFSLVYIGSIHLVDHRVDGVVEWMELER